MTGLGKKRKSTGVLEEATKRMRIEPRSNIRENSYKITEDSDEESERYFEVSSENGQSPNADTPLTPFSTPRKFPSELKIIRCTFEGCTKSFNRPARLAAHIRSHNNDRPFACDYSGCDKTYIEEKHLRQHIKGSHTHEKPYGCDWGGCGKSFLTATRLRRHREAHEGHDRFRCTGYPQCSQTFRKHQTLQRHIRAEHLQQAPFPCTYVVPETQELCIMGFDTNGALRKHEDRVHGALRFWCDECSIPEGTHGQDVPRQIGFRTKTELGKHIRSEHSNCLFCDLKCNSQLELERHMETLHSTNGIPQPGTKISDHKTVPCTIPGCAKTFTKKYNLDVHVRTAHKGQRFMCSASSTISNNFKSPEIALWTGINACGRGFISKATLEDHIRTQHLGLPSVVNANRLKHESSGEKKSKQPIKNDEDLDAIHLLTGIGYAQDPSRNIACLISGCQWRFMRQYDLTVHLRSTHNLSRSEIETGAKNYVSQTDIHSPDSHRSTLESTYGQADLEWDMQYAAAAAAEDGENEDTPFWIGADDQDSADEAVDTWIREEEQEMRILCGQEEDWEVVLDPELCGM